MIKDFRDKETQKLYITGKSSKFPNSIINVSLRKLDYLNAAVSILDLKSPPGNRLEPLKESIKGNIVLGLMTSTELCSLLKSRMLMMLKL